MNPDYVYVIVRVTRESDLRLKPLVARTQLISSLIMFRIAHEGICYFLKLLQTHYCFYLRKD